MEMQPKYLELQAFGPYVEKQVIDFQQFEGKHLFLIQGETGSGKTMLLDAMTYALYGKSSGGQREQFETMRSRFAPDDLDTNVSFTFMLHGKMYRFSRSITVKYKRNQEKTYKIRMDAGEIKDGEFFPFFENPKQRMLEEKAEKIIKLSYEQFVQVILLPQGKFERFLTSKSEEKQAILKTLFQMEKWEKICTWMHEHVKEEKKTLETLRQQKAAYLQTLQQESIQTFLVSLQEKKQNLAAKELQLKEAYKILKQQEEELFLQRDLCHWQQQLDKAKEKQEVLAKEKLQVQEDENIVLYGEKQHRIFPIYLQHQEVQKQYEKRKWEAQQAEQKYQSAKQQLEKEPMLQEEWKQKKERLYTYQQLHLTYEKQKVALDVIKELQQQVTYWQQQESLQMEALVKTKQAYETMLQSEQQLQQEEQRIKETMHFYQQVEQMWKLYQQAYPHWQAQQRYIQQKVQVDQEIKQFQRQEEQQKQLVAHLQYEHDQCYQLVLDSSLAQLVSQLQEGNPCPVCGSTHHPQKAHVQQVIVDITDLKEKKQVLEKEKQRHDDIVHHVQIRKEKLVEYQEMIRQAEQEQITIFQHVLDESTYQEIEKQYVHLMALKEQQQMIVQQYQEIHQRMQAYQKEMEEIQQQVMQCKQEIKKYEISLVKEKEVFEEEDISLDVVLYRMSQNKVAMQEMEKDMQNLQQHIENLHVQVQIGKQRVESARNEFNVTKQQLDRLTLELQIAYQKEDLDETCMTTILDQASIAQKQRRIQEYYETVAVIKNTIVQANLYLKGKVVKDIASLQEAWQEQKEKVRLLEQEHARLKEVVTQYRQLQTQLDAVQEKIQRIEPSVMKKENFAKALRGDNSVGIERYVLGILLSMITQHANYLLQNVHDGRYLLYRSDESTGKTRKTGLELSVFDHYTLSKRSVLSLSGGEKFLVSLALSFAMLLVMQSQNGGVQLDMMFVDEGFGSLDEQSIDDALSILQIMTQKKGIVGIISHVEMLKESIATGLAVVKTEKGSRVQMKIG